MTLPKSALKSWKTHTTSIGGIKSHIWYDNQFLLNDSGSSIMALYYPNEHNGDSPLLIVEFSLPVLLYGNNHHPIDHLQLATDSANIKIASITELPIDIRSGIPNRLDLFYDHQVGESVQPWLYAISNLEYPRRKTVVYRGEGVTFGTSKSLLKFYDKYRESKDEATKGILRQELQIRKTPLIRRVLQLEQEELVLGDITDDIISSQLIRELEILCLHSVEIPNPLILMDLLHDVFPRAQAERCYALILSLQTMTAKEYVARYQVNRSSLRKDLQAIRTAGIPMAVSQIPLPPLFIDKPENAQILRPMS